MSDLSRNNVVQDAWEQTFSRHPYLFVFVISVSLAVVFWSWKVYAQKVDVSEQFKQVHEQIDSIEATIKGVNNDTDRRFDQLEQVGERRHLESQLRSLDTEIYQLQRLEQSQEANDRDLARLDDLRIQRGTQARKLQRLETAK